MKIRDMFNGKKSVLSFEIFPPTRNYPVEKLYKTLDEMKDLDPAFISVTYGASGVIADNATIEIAADIKNRYGIESMAHVTCVNSTEGDIDGMLEMMQDNGIENILALRGDDIPDVTRKHDFEHASDLIAYIKSKEMDFGISGACYPEGHQDSPDLVSDTLNLRKKVDAGADHLVSQLFFDNRMFYDFQERLKLAGIDVPVEAGIMPVTSAKQITRMVSMCGASLPPKFAKMMQRYGDNPEAMRDAGIAYAVDQIVDLLSHGVDGIHLYTMNNAYVARKITESVSSLL
jgi:methylenetetrahydrofolate reductase (NADPH)